jgi:hypothetical protein
LGKKRRQEKKPDVKEKADPYDLPQETAMLMIDVKKNIALVYNLNFRFSLAKTSDFSGKFQRKNPKRRVTHP